MNRNSKRCLCDSLSATCNLVYSPAEKQEVWTSTKHGHNRQAILYDALTGYSQTHHDYHQDAGYQEQDPRGNGALHRGEMEALLL